MAYDEDLADRVRAAIPRNADVTERKMFGGLAFLLDGHMFAGIVGHELMVLLGYQAAQQALERDHVREMDFTGRPMKNMIFVQPAGLRGRRCETGSPLPPTTPAPCLRNHPKYPMHRAASRSGGGTVTASRRSQAGHGGAGGAPELEQPNRGVNVGPWGSADTGREMRWSGI